MRPATVLLASPDRPVTCCTIHGDLRPAVFVVAQASLRIWLGCVSVEVDISPDSGSSPFRIYFVLRLLPLTKYTDGVV